MSDIAKKTLPSRSKGKKQQQQQQQQEEVSTPQAEENIPRSAPPEIDLQKEQNKNREEEEEHDEVVTTSGDFNSEEDSGVYTHLEEKPKEGEGEGEGEQEGEGEEKEGIKLEDKERGELEEVEPKAIPEKTETEARVGEEDVKAAPDEKAAGEQDTPAAADEISDAPVGLTEQAKKAFDQASRGQPTDEAREEFLQSAREGVDDKAAGGKSDVEAKSETVDRAASEKPDVEAADNDIGEPERAVSEKPDVDDTKTVSDKTESQVEKASSEKPDVDVQEQQVEPETKTETDIDAPVEEQFDPHHIQEGQSQVQDFSQSQVQPEGTIQEGQPEETIPDEQPQGVEAGEGSTVAEHMDFSVLKHGIVNKGGNVIADGKVVGRVTSGILQYLIGKKVDENGDIWSDNGKIIGKAEPISDSERDDMLKEPAPFESFPDAVVDGNGMVVSNGEWVGKIVEGDVKKLRGKQVDPDGDVLDKAGNVIGKAERWEPEPEEEEEVKEVDNSLLAGKRVNKAGYVVDGSGVIYGRVVEGDAKRMVGRMCDRNGNILSESGDVLGRAELVTEGEREGSKEGPFAELEGCTVAKDGTVVTPSGDVVGRLVKGEGKILFGRAVDEDGDVLDKNGNVIGKAERWEPEEVEKSKNAMSGRRVNKEGNVVDADGNIIGKLTSGNPQICSGKEIDDDGDVVDQKGTVIGHCSLLEDIPDEVKDEETPEEKEKREQAESDKKMAIQMSVCIAQCLDKIRPICKMITEKIDKAERTPEDERDEEQLVKEVRPLIEEGGRILTEAQGIIKGLDPDGRISANAKHKTAAREATPEEYRLADLLKDLTGDVTQCIDNAKRKLEDMPHAKKELNPLWGLLNEPLFQILAAVGLLLSGVLNLVGRLLSGLGLGGLVDGLLGTLGLNRVLAGLGLGSFSESLKSGKKKKGGLLGGILGG
ncbi:hypothetical protein QBC40DRAFT_66274 [Triangularia verruculosa]|uniref:DUF6987 domain-containing protein n=1 Tax=Triangularia verruculosa TaxID=2587418 RepID=A0AAN6XRE3_9PEZI|nr:hypothetical protein QBC40DRAFT_66274 [Triangularia verruculosa]